MRVCSVLGRPRPQGNTAKVLGWVDDELKKARAFAHTLGGKV